jgi:tetratricopeptide (TPR) repeat protein
MDSASKKMYAEALELYDKGKVKEALEGLKKVAGQYASYPDVHNALGLAYSYLGNNQMAIASFQKAVELNPNYIEAYVNLAIVYNDQCQYDAAIKSFEHAANLETKDKGLSPQIKAKLANTYVQLGDTYYELQEFQKAREEYERAAKISPAFLDIKLKLAKTYTQLDDFKKAESILHEILDRNRKYLDARTLLGLCFYQRQKYADATC